MNIGLLMLALLLVTGSILGIFMIASQNQVVYTDSFGNIQSNVTNDTQSTVTNTTAPLTQAAGGFALFIGAVIVFVVVIVLIVNVKSSLNGRR